MSIYTEQGKFTGKHMLFIAASFISFFMFAIPYNMHGSNAPVMMEFYGIRATQQGFVITMQSVGAIATAIFIALKGERYSKIHVISLALVIISLSCVAIGLVPAYTVLVILIVALGVGNASIDVMMNGVIADVYGEKKDTFLPIVHGFFVIGAMFAPIFIGFVVDPARPETFAQPFRILSVFAAMVFLLYFFSGRSIRQDTPYIAMEAMKKRVRENPAELFKTKKAWVYFIAALLYVTFQYGTNMWLPTYALQNVDADFRTSGLMVTAFYGPALAMRFLTPLFLRRISHRIFYSVLGFAAALIMIAAYLIQSIPVMFALIITVGFLQGSIIVVLIMMLTDSFPGRSGSASAIVALAGGTGTLTAPLWMGALSEYIGGFRIPMIMICCSLAASAIVVFLFGEPLKTGQNEQKA